MKTKNLFLSLFMSIVFVFAITDSYAIDNKKERKTILLKADLHCQSCVDKIEKNIPFEKGVKDLKVDLKTNTISITYRTDKNNKDNIIKAIEKLGVKVLDNEGCTGKCGESCCKVTGDKSKCCKKEHKHNHNEAVSNCSKKHDCKTCDDKGCNKKQECLGDCKSCKHKSCTKTDASAKAEKKHKCTGC